MPPALRPVSKSTSSEPVLTTVGVKKNWALSVGILAACEAAAKSSSEAFRPKMFCGPGTVRVPASRVVTSNPPSLTRLKRVVAMPIISAAAKAGLAAARGRAPAPIRAARRVMVIGVLRVMETSLSVFDLSRVYSGAGLADDSHAELRAQATVFSRTGQIRGPVRHRASPLSESFHDNDPLRAIAHRLHSYRQPAHRTDELPHRAQGGRLLHPADRRHGPGALERRICRCDQGRPRMAWVDLGPDRAPVGAAGALRGGRGQAARERAALRGVRDAHGARPQAQEAAQHGQAAGL